MCVRVELLFCLSLRHRTIFYIGTLLILMVCVCVRAHAGVSAFGCCFVSANGLLVDICQYCCLLMFVCLPLSRHFPCCKTWWIKNQNLKHWQMHTSKYWHQQWHANMHARTHTHTDNSNNNILYSFQWGIKAAVQPLTLKHNQKLTLNSISIIKVNTDIKALRHTYTHCLSVDAHLMLIT